MEVTRGNGRNGKDGKHLRKPRGLTKEGFEALLGQLDPDDLDRAARLYEAIRRRLIRLFEWRGCEDPEDLADETINRVSRRLAEGVKLHASDPYGYFCGVAHHVYKEVLRQSSRQRRALESGGWPPPEPVPEADNLHLECLRWCLRGLSEKERDLVLRYHQGENNIRNRQTLARELGIQLNALRIRIHRIRRKLEDCVFRCLEH
jgi:DNA-directed RNA polymerase specialized sigma24 family protein